MRLGGARRTAERCNSDHWWQRAACRTKAGVPASHSAIGPRNSTPRSWWRWSCKSTGRCLASHPELRKAERTSNGKRAIGEQSCVASCSGICCTIALRGVCNKFKREADAGRLSMAGCSKARRPRSADRTPQYVSFAPPPLAKWMRALTQINEDMFFDAQSHRAMWQHNAERNPTDAGQRWQSSCTYSPSNTAPFAYVYLSCLLPRRWRTIDA